jgi:hypothetical protein
MDNELAAIYGDSRLADGIPLNAASSARES